MKPRAMVPKYGFALTTPEWSGLPLRVGSYLGNGKTEGLVAAEDALLLWSGGLSDVTINARLAGQGSTSHRTLEFSRRGGMIDFLPRGTCLDEIEWRGQASGCVSVSLDRSWVERMMGGKVMAFDAERAFRLNVTDAHVVDLVRRLEAQAVQNEPLGALYVEGLSLTLASYVYGHYRAAEPERAEAKLPLSETEKLMAFVEDHLDTDIGIRELARVAQRSPDHLAKIFKKSFGVSLHRYVTRRRVERAKSLLRDRSYSIAEVALTCGFATQSHFTYVFKAMTGVTPGAYRRG
jgi:AraC family transcriptional regulator